MSTESNLIDKDPSEKYSEAKKEVNNNDSDEIIVE
jgi:hypothetical protein